MHNVPTMLPVCLIDVIWQSLRILRESERLDKGAATGSTDTCLPAFTASSRPTSSCAAKWVVVKSHGLPAANQLGVASLFGQLLTDALLILDAVEGMALRPCE